MTKRNRDGFKRESEVSLPYTNSGRCQFCSFLLDIAVFALTRFMPIPYPVNVKPS